VNTSSYYALHLLDPILRQWGQHSGHTLTGLTPAIHYTSTLSPFTPLLPFTDDLHCSLLYHQGRLITHNTPHSAFITPTILSEVTTLLHLHSFLHRSTKAGFKSRVWRLHWPDDDGGWVEVVMSAVGVSDWVCVVLLSPHIITTDPYLTTTMRSVLNSTKPQPGLLFSFLTHPSLLIIVHPTLTTLSSRLYTSVLHVQCRLKELTSAFPAIDSSSRPFAHHPDLIALRSVREFGLLYEDDDGDRQWVVGRMRRDGNGVIIITPQQPQHNNDDMWQTGWRLLDQWLLRDR
jgi:hypothetical protein